MAFTDELRESLSAEAKNVRVRRRDPESIRKRIRYRQALLLITTCLMTTGVIVVGIMATNFIDGDNVGVADAQRGTGGSGSAAGIIAAPGRRGILFTALSSTSGEPQIFHAEKDGTGVEQVTDGLPSQGAAWSPDGSQIVLSRGSDSNPQLYLMDADGSTLTQLTKGGADSQPSWSPNGHKIAFVRNVAGNDDIFIINADGTELLRLTAGPLPEYDPSWSPDGSKIAFTRTNKGDGNLGVYTMNADGGGVRVIVDTPGSESSPVWSPDGLDVAFAREKPNSDQADLWTVGADGSGVRALSQEAGDERPASWLPDGRRIIYYGGQPGQWLGYVFDTSSGRTWRLISQPMWAPTRLSWRG